MCPLGKSFSSFFFFYLNMPGAGVAPVCSAQCPAAETALKLPVPPLLISTLLLAFSLIPHDSWVSYCPVPSVVYLIHSMQVT